jgi:FkbM family methyltransferase
MGLLTYGTGRTDYRALTPPLGAQAQVRSRRSGKRYRFALRPGTTDAYSFIQVFQQEHYRAKDFARFADLEAAYQAILARGRTPLILDCGANNGMSAAYFADCWPDARVVAVEPAAANARLLRANTEGLKVDVIEAAIASRAQKLAIVNPTGDANAFQVAPAAERPEATVEGLSIPDLLARYPEARFAPFLIKIDIEGFERDLFAANTGWIERFPLMIVELHDWMAPGEALSGNFLKVIAEQDRDLLFRGDSVFSIRNRARSRQDPAQGARRSA